MLRNQSLTRFARLAWLALAGLALAIQLANFPSSLEHLYSDPQVASSYSVFSEIFSYQLYARYIFILRYFVIAIFWVVAVHVYIQNGRQLGKHSWVSLYTAYFLILFPILLIGNGAGAQLAPPWGSILLTSVALMGSMALAMLVFLYFIFPDGSFTPGWMRWVAYTLGVGIAALFISLWSGLLSADWAWQATMILLLVALTLGIGSQVYRYLRVADEAQKRQTFWMVLALTSLPIIVLIGGQQSSRVGAVIFLHLQILVPALLPLMLFISVSSRSLWDFELPYLFTRSLVVPITALAITFLGILVLGTKANQNPADHAISFEPLPDTGIRRPVLIDTDMAPDDWLAILFMLQRPDIRVLAITVSGTGEAHCQPGIHNALSLIALAGASDIPVACGRETPLEGEHVFPDAWREQSDTLAGLDLPEGQNPYTRLSSADTLIIDTVKNSPDAVTLLTLGPLTNLAVAIQQDAAFLRNITQIYVMGGALEVLGNVGLSGVDIDNQVAEWNIFIDPQATRIVLASGAPVTLVPLDATNQVPATLDFYFRLQANRRTPEAEFAYDVLSTQVDFIASGGYTFWDPFTASLLVDESLGYIKQGRIWVSTDPGTTSGLTRVLNSGFPARYAKSAEAPRFEYEFLRALNQP